MQVMHHHQHKLAAIVIALTMAASSIICCAQNSQPEVTSTIQKSNGLETVEFDTLTGTVEVNLPDDLSATDTISGTVLVEPKGETKEEIAQNEDTLRGYVVEIEKTQEVEEPPTEKKPPAKPPSTNKPPNAIPPVCKPPVITNKPPQIYVVPGCTPTYTTRIPNGCGTIRIVIRNRGGDAVCNQQVTCNPKPPACPPTRIPTQGTCGTPLRIPGRCDGRSSTSRVTINGSNCPVLAESPRQQVCGTPLTTTGTCNIVRNEQGVRTCGTITMKPPMGLINSGLRPPATPAPPAATIFAFERTGPFVTQETPSCYADQGNTVNITNSSISWTGPQYIKGDPMVSSTFNYQAPPEIIAVGDKITLSASTSGDERVGTQGQYGPDHSWIKPLPNPRSVTLSQGYGQPSGTFQFEVIDYVKFLDDALKQHPEYANKVTPEMRNKMPMIYLYCPGRINVRLEWKYVPLKKRKLH